MKRTSITDAKNQLSALLQRVRHGETIIIEDRGVPIAEVRPITGSGAATDRARIARLERQGILRPAGSRQRRSRSIRPPLRPGQRVALSQLVRLERDEGW